MFTIHETRSQRSHPYDTIKRNAKAYLNNQECSAGKVIYPILLELKLERIFTTVYLININFPGERVQVLFSEKELSKLPYICPSIFKKSNVDCYMERSSVTFCNGKYCVLNDFSYAEFLVY